MNARALGLAAMAVAFIATGALGPALAQQQRFDGYYQGNLECEQSGIGMLRTKLSVFVRTGQIAVGMSARFDIDGHITKLSPDGAQGVVDVDGAFRLGKTVSYTRDVTYESTYAGTLSRNGGTITGTQVWTRVPAGRNPVSRICKGTFVKVDPPHKRFDGHYKGNLECEQSGIVVLRASLVVVIEGDYVLAIASLFDIDGREKSGREPATDEDGAFRVQREVAKGIVDADGAFRLADIVNTDDAIFRSGYTGTLSRTGGAMTGTHAWTRLPGGNSVSRACKGTFVSTELK